MITAMQSDDSQRPRYLLGLITLTTLAICGPLLAWNVIRFLYPARWTLAALVAVAEWTFYIFYYRRTYQEFNKIPAVCRPKGFTIAQGLRNWQRFINTLRKVPGGFDPEPYLTQWFCNAPYGDIKRSNVEEMLVYGFFYCKREELPKEYTKIPGQLVTQLEAALHTKFEPGYNPRLRFMSHLWEPLRAHYRPLCLYLFFEALYGAQRLIMASYGFKAKKLGLLGYYTLSCGLDSGSVPGDINSNGTTDAYEDADWTPFAAPAERTAPGNPLNEAVPQHDKSTPVMFLHGVGGLMLYLEMLKHVIGLGHPVIVIEYKHVAMRLCNYIPTVDEVTENVVRILEYERIPRVCVVGHSYGSFMASRLNALHRERMHSLCLIDPVCIGMFMPHLLHNFMYRRPRVDWKHPDILIRDLVLWFASRDIHISATFARNFYWSDLNLWPEDLPAGSCVVLSGNDDLCHAEEVKKMLDAAGQAKVILNPHLFHGAFLLDPSSKAHLMVEVRALLATSGSLVARLARPVMDRTLSAARSLLHEVETLKTRFSVMGPGSPRHHDTLHRSGGRSLRRTITDLPMHAWQRVASFGPAQRIKSMGPVRMGSGVAHLQQEAAQREAAAAAAVAAADAEAAGTRAANVGTTEIAPTAQNGVGDSKQQFEQGLSTIPSGSGGSSGSRSSDAAGSSSRSSVASEAAAAGVLGSFDHLGVDDNHRILADNDVVASRTGGVGNSSNSGLGFQRRAVSTPPHLSLHKQQPHIDAAADTVAVQQDQLRSDEALQQQLQKEAEELQKVVLQSQGRQQHVQQRE